MISRMIAMRGRKQLLPCYGREDLRWLHNEDALATKKLAGGVRKFNSYVHHLQEFALSQVAEKVG
jgi:transaldolase